MRTVIGNQITVHEPSTKLRLWTRRNLEIANPEYAKKLQMGFWLGATPKVIRLYEDEGPVLRMPYGCLREIHNLIGEGIIASSFSDPQYVEFGGEVPLYDYQEEAVRATIAARYGILQSAAGSGKTQMGLAIASRLHRKTLWLTHTKDLLEQSKARAEMYFDKKKFGVISEGKVKIGETITFATIQTMSHCDLLAMRDVWDCIIVDECHRVAGSPTAVTMFSKVLNNLRARWKYGLSATVHRADGMIRATYALLGSVVYKVPDEAVKERVMPVTVCPRGTGVSLTYECMKPDGMIDYPKMINWLTQSNGRNWMILEDLKDNRDHYNLVLSERVEHLKNLQCGLSERGINSHMIDGKTPKLLREKVLEAMREGKSHVLLATYALAREGLDIPILDRLYLATPQKDYAVVVQSVGRVARVFDGKETAVVYDYVDNAPNLVRAYKKRLGHYRKIGASIEEEA